MTQQPTDYLTICDMIDDGEYDEGLQQIAAAIVSRREVVDRRNGRRLARTLKVGDRVRIVDIKPKFLIGMVGTVLEMRLTDGSAKIELDAKPTGGRGRPSAASNSKRFVVPFENLRIADADATELSRKPPKDEIGDDSDDEEDDDDEDED